MFPPELPSAQLLPAGLAALAGFGWWREFAKGRRLSQHTEGLSLEVEQLRQNLTHLEQVASIDRLTGAWNRLRFEEAAAAEMGLCHRRRSPLSMIMLDLDHFKSINDTFGHPAGDRVLAGAARAFRPHLRSSDALVRWGGEEFLVLAPATGLDGALRLAERLRQALESTPFPDAKPITLSAGVAEYGSDESLETWLGRADQALYQAKGAGRNQVMADRTKVSDATSHQSGLLELVWEEAYSSGHPLIDEQHIRLFVLANGLLSALVEGQSHALIETRLDNLLHHTEKHFRDEEALLRKAKFPDLENHHGEHSRLLASARQFQTELASGQVDFGRLVSYLATDLVKGHLLTEDCHYFSHLHEPA